MWALALSFQAFLPPTRFDWVQVPLLDLDSPATGDSIELRLPRDGDAIASESVPVAGGWLFWSEERKRRLSSWHKGHPFRLHADHLTSGQRLAWDLPGIDEEERRRWEGRFDGADTEWPSSFWSGATIAELPRGEGFLLQDAADGRRTAIHLGLDGTWRKVPELEPGPWWVPLTVEFELGVTGHALAGVHTASIETWSLERASGDLLDLAKGVIDPKWSDEVIGDGWVGHYVSHGVLDSEGAWVLELTTSISRRLESPGSPGGNPGPFSRTLVRADARSGRVLARAAIRDGDAFHVALASYTPELWTDGTTVRALSAWPEEEGELEVGTWTFAETKPGPDGALLVGARSVEGPRVRSRPEFLGMLAPGTAVYFDRFAAASDAARGWIVVRGGSR